MNPMSEDEYAQRREECAHRMAEALETMPNSTVAELYSVMMDIRHTVEAERARAAAAFILGGDLEIDDMFDELIDLLTFYETGMNECLRARSEATADDIREKLRKYRAMDRAKREATRNGHRADDPGLPY